MLRTLLALLVLGLAPQLNAARALECVDAASGDKTRVTPQQVKKALKRVQRVLKASGLHVLDLSAEAQERHARLAEDVPAQEWCKVRAHVLSIESAASGIHVDQGFLTGKLARTQRFAQARSSDAKRKEETDRLLATAAAHQAEGRLVQANQMLNRILLMALGTRDLWEVPADLAPRDGDGPGVASASTVSADEVASACPEMAKRGSAGRTDVEDILARLSAEVDQRKLRPLDIQGGEQLTADLAGYLELGAWFPAARAGCALHDRYHKLDVDLGVVMKRFARVNALRDERGLADSARANFTTLVRRASDHIAQRQFSDAHAALEELLLSFGEPAPSRLVPAMPLIERGNP
ncbi:MAG: hypothetical protein HYZ27_04070 [Deltaproteobacteria bacterium]|nr:hypothetical protein [Deltaproteobacteria bacterium]